MRQRAYTPASSFSRWHPGEPQRAGDLGIFLAGLNVSSPLPFLRKKRWSFSQVVTREGEGCSLEQGGRSVILKYHLRCSGQYPIRSAVYNPVFYKSKSQPKRALFKEKGNPVVIRGLTCLWLIPLPCHAYSVTADLTWNEIKVSILWLFFFFTWIPTQNIILHNATVIVFLFFSFCSFCLFDHVQNNTAKLKQGTLSISSF